MPITIETSAGWHTFRNIFGITNTPLMLNVQIHNNSNGVFTIRDICISVKSRLGFNTKDILRNIMNWEVQPNSSQVFEIDLRHMLNEFSFTKKFTVKVNARYESNKLTINELTRTQQNTINRNRF